MTFTMNMQVKGPTARPTPLAKPEEKSATAGAQSTAFATPTGMPTGKRPSPCAAASGQAPRQTGFLPNKRATLPHMAPVSDAGAQRAPTEAKLNGASINHGFETIKKDAHREPQITVGGGIRAPKSALMEGTIAEIQKKLGVPTKELAELEMAVAHFGAGAKLLFGDARKGIAALNPAEVIGKLGYTTHKGVVALAVIAHELEEFLPNRLQTGGANDDAIDLITDEKPGDISTDSPADSPLVKAAIAQGQSAAQIVKNPENKCVTALDVMAVCDAKLEHDKNNGV
jgi:hypothetical protein